MIHKLRLKNFKSIVNQTYEFEDFDLLVGFNNSGKSTVLQALAIWQYCVDQFRRSKRTGTKGIQIVLPNFTALPVPEFILLWNDKTERTYPETSGKKTQVFILIEIEVFWRDANGDDRSLNVQLRYQSPQSVYAKPDGGWADFKILEKTDAFPRIVYVPPFSGLEPNEFWFDDANLRRNVGKAQPGSVLRNLLFRVVDREDIAAASNADWMEIVERTKEWFGVVLNVPIYEKGESIDIQVSFNSHGKDFDIISGGSGFHQILTLLAFFYGYPGITTILFDEPDAHLHVHLQRQILNYFKLKKKMQFLIATHAEEFIRGVEVNSIVSLLSGGPSRVSSSQGVIKAMSDLDNMAVISTKQSPFVLYVEGEDDERILRAWSEALGKASLISNFFFEYMGGGTKDQMKDRSAIHFEALRQVNPQVRRIVLFDYDSENSYHPEADNPVLYEWKRMNIENYLLVPDAWKQAVLDAFNATDLTLFGPLVAAYNNIIDSFFAEQNITLATGFSWQNVTANIFQVVDGKKILFEDETSLFQRLRNDSGPIINREKVATNMSAEMIHNDVVEFFELLEGAVG